ncbi:MAG: hypothetical protein KAS72_07760 [Phycisphaerales bacterium]|nr:hypothetical protein [Phycisphaerales bacterium]
MTTAPKPEDALAGSFADDVDAELRARIDELDDLAADDFYLKIHRLDGGQWAFVADVSWDQWETDGESLIADNYGPGRYKLTLRHRGKRGNLKVKQLAIAGSGGGVGGLPTFPLSTPSPVLDDIRNRITEQRAANDPMPMFVAMMQATSNQNQALLQALIQTQGVGQPSGASTADMIAGMRELVELAPKLTGGGSETDTLTAGIQAFGAIMDQRRSDAERELAALHNRIAELRGRAQHRSITPAPSARPAAPPGALPVASPPTDAETMPAAFRTLVELLALGCAADEPNPDAYAQIILDGSDPDVLLSFVRNGAAGAWLLELGAQYPDRLNQPEFLNQVGEALADLLDMKADDDNDAATPDDVSGQTGDLAATPPAA